ncbi:MAG: bifunctional UDP-N-acetylmuramoyl-tripeptide:D-alanyl-D-alanine ligase/alanine racemase [Culturomica sp.]|jgi:alanine racemase|nr:bifunctional UDP-N-acetylmuramoyl-tripeptide:D-alanyl-D-alanine ligase/alanine racemase [Culturomica sp.]
MNISIDSRFISKPEDTVFFAFKGKNHNGHDYVADLYARGVRRFVVSEMREEYNDLKGAEIRFTDSVLDVLQEYAGEHRREMRAEVIAITGSNGKTVLKEWLYQLLVDDYNVYRSPRSYNSQIGVPLALMGIEADTEIALIEAGISQKGEMERLERMIQPDVAIFTHFGDAHSENFDSDDERLSEKAVLFRHAKMIIGRNTKEMRQLLAAADAKAEHLLWDEVGEADIKARTLEITATERLVEVEYADTHFELRLPFADEASFENCMHAVCVMLFKGIDMDVMRERIARLQSLAMRMEIKEGVNNSILINDYYNSDITSFAISLNVLMMQDETKERTVILSDFTDIKINRRELYSKVASMLTTANVRLFIGIGEELQEHRELFPVSSRFYTDTEAFLKKEKRSNFTDKAILIKGARRFSLEYVRNFLQLQTHNTVLEVNMDNMISNLNYFRSLLPEGVKVAVMLKAFAYGAGFDEIANLLQYNGVDCFMTAFADEGVALRANGITLPVVVMDPEPEVFDTMIEFNLEPEIYSLALLQNFNLALKHHGVEKYPVHIKLNTGMNRAGFDENDLPQLLKILESNDNRTEIRSVFSHLAAADDEIHDDFTRMQIDKFTRMSDIIGSRFDYHIMRHILNSAGIERFPSAAFDMVRLGIGLHGVSVAGKQLLTVSTFKSYVMALRTLESTETVGYGRMGVLQRKTRLAIVPVGYADGLNRRLSNGVGEMYINGYRAPIVGNICMDTCMIDITDVEAEVKVGDEVEIFGNHISIVEFASRLDTIPYEILTAVNQRVKRIYIKE